MFFKHILWIGVFVFLSIVAAPQVQAQTKDAEQGAIGVVMAVMDTDGIYANAKAMKNIHEQFAKYQSKMQADVDAQKMTLQKDEESLNRQRSVLAPEVYAEKRKEFQSRIVAFQRGAQEKNLKLNQVRAQATSKVSDALLEVLQEIVKKNGITIVFHKKQTVFANPGMDITKLVLEGLDQRLPAVQVDDPMK